MYRGILGQWKSIERVVNEAYETYQNGGIRSLIDAGYDRVYAWLLEGRYLLRAVVLNETAVQHQMVELDLAEPALRDIRIGVLRGEYERSDCEVVRRHLKDADVDVVELGGGCGFVSCCINQSLQSSHRHLVIEANERLIPVLRRTRERNGCDFDIRHLAYSAYDTVVDFYEHGDFPSHSAHTERASNDAVPVEATNLSTIVEEEGFSSFVLVADIEGAEFELIDAELEILLDHCPLLIIEFHDFTSHSIDAYDYYLADSGFDRIDTEGMIYVYENRNKDAGFLA